MSWVCPHDRGMLTETVGAMSCPTCSRSYTTVGGAPVFTDAPRPAPPRLEELLQAVQNDGVEAAARQFCEAHDCARNPFSADWKFFFPVPSGGTLLEIGAGFGDDSAHLAGNGGPLMLLVPGEVNARIVLAHLVERDVERAHVAVTTDLTHLPLTDGSVDAITMEDAAGPSFGLTSSTLGVAAAEWRRVLKPGGVLFFGMSNRLDRGLGLRHVRARLAKDRPDSLNRLVKREGAPSGAKSLGLRATLRALESAGFDIPRIYTPLPDERQTQLVVPTEDRQVIRYFLNNMVRKNSRAVRVALRVADGLVSLGLFRPFAPYFYLICKAGE